MLLNMFFITAKFVLWWPHAWMQYFVITPTSPSSLISLTPSSILPPPHKSFSYTHVFLFCFCDPLFLTRDIYVNVCLELFSGAWWAHTKESNNFPTSRSHYVQVREGWGLWYPPLSVINCSQVILCRPKADNHSCCEIIIAMALSCPENGNLQLAFSIFLLLLPQCSMSFRGIDINVLFRMMT